MRQRDAQTLQEPRHQRASMPSFATCVAVLTAPRRNDDAALARATRLQRAVGMSALSAFRAGLILPPEISNFERQYLRRINRLALIAYLAHVPLFTAIAFFNETGPLQALVLTSLGALGPWLAEKFFANPRRVSVVHGVTAMFMGALLVHFGRGLWTIEMHFYFFVLLALLAVFANPMVILAAAVTAALHHAVLWAIAPQSVFNYDAPFSSVAVHATFVVVESLVAGWVARSFFDNVIGLERIVSERTREIRMIFGAVRQGFLSFDAQGRLSCEHSRAVETWFGEPAVNASVFDYFNSIEPTFGAWFKLGWEGVQEGFLPREVALAQLPRQFSRDGRTFEVEYQPMDGKLERTLLVISDVTERLERERADRLQRETVQVFERVMRDRSGFLEFFAEASEQVKALQTPGDDTIERRHIHTLKGNCALFGMSTIAEHCHALETRLAEPGERFGDEARKALAAEWKAASDRVMRFLGTGSSAAIEIDETDYMAILKAIDAGTPPPEIRRMIESWRHELVQKRFERLGEQAVQLAERLGKGELDVRIDARGVRVPKEGFEPLWSSAVHLIRNAVDHGLEDPAVRRGRLEFIARSKPGELELEFKDNGRGINWKRVEAKARERHLPIGDPRALEAALFADGFSTKEEVTDTSGRGVGLSAVREAVERIGGHIEVQSELGAGTAFRIHLPV